MALLIKYGMGSYGALLCADEIIDLIKGQAS
jgi:hypothetical protein